MIDCDCKIRALKKCEIQNQYNLSTNTSPKASKVTFMSCFINSTNLILGTHFICGNFWVGLLNAQLSALFRPYFCIAALKTYCFA